MSDMKILALDIETAPNVCHTWGLFNQNIGINQIVQPGYTLCVAAKWIGNGKVMFFKHTDKGFLKSVWTLLNEADAVCHYNGRNFDMPILNKEFIERDMPPPAPYHQIDLLQVARKRFRFTSNKLDFVAQFLGLGGKHHHKGHSLWTEVMAGDKKAWKTMEKYNIQDVKLLETLYYKVLPWIQNHPNHALYVEDNRPCCPNCGSTKVLKCGTETTLTMTYQRYRCGECNTPIRGRTNVLTKEKRASILTQSKL
jgi:DNA polymerase elongation subunit (family B)